MHSIVQTNKQTDRTAALRSGRRLVLHKRVFGVYPDRGERIRRKLGVREDARQSELLDLPVTQKERKKCET
jgi:hypothetical protein